MSVCPVQLLSLALLIPPATTIGASAATCEAEFTAMGGIPVRLAAEGLADGLCGAVMAGVEVELRALERVMSAYTPHGAVAAINRGAHTGGPCPRELAEVLQVALVASRDTGGAFDVTVGPLVRLWKQAGKDGRLPAEEERAAALALVGYGAVRVEDGALHIDVPGVRVDLGGVAKGYFGDVAIQRLRQAGATRCIADVGADLVTWRAAEQPEFTVGIRNPWGEGLMGVIRATGGAVVTSGDYERYVTIDGKRYCHIVDPRTGQPVEGMRSVTVLAPTGAEADALATALFVLGYDAAAALVEGRADLEAVIVADESGSPDQQRVFISAGLAERFQWSDDVLPQ